MHQEVYDIRLIATSLRVKRATKPLPTKGWDTPKKRKDQRAPDAANHTARAREDRHCKHRDAQNQSLEK